VADLLKELAANPLDDLEVGQLYNPAMVPDLLPEKALSLEADGVPRWFPTEHPETPEPLTQDQAAEVAARRAHGRLERCESPFSPGRAAMVASKPRAVSAPNVPGMDAGTGPCT
jgi:hypothetical protein